MYFTHTTRRALRSLAIATAFVTIAAACGTETESGVTTDGSAGSSEQFPSTTESPPSPEPDRSDAEPAVDEADATSSA
ncbi:MAG: hypothetical protein AB8G26_03655, partial [Ilumatobacter sp.]